MGSQSQVLSDQCTTMLLKYILPLFLVVSCSAFSISGLFEDNVAALDSPVVMAMAYEAEEDLNIDEEEKNDDEIDEDEEMEEEEDEEISAFEEEEEDENDDE